MAFLIFWNLIMKRMRLNVSHAKVSHRAVGLHRAYDTECVMATSIPTLLAKRSILYGIDGETFVVLSNTNGILAVYLVSEFGELELVEDYPEKLAELVES